MLQTLRLLRYATLLLAVTACSGPAPLKWEESVVLPDGRIVVLKREQHFDERGYLGAHSFEFRHPVTGQSVKWSSDATLYSQALLQPAMQQAKPTEGFFRLVALFMVQDVPHILVAPTFGGHAEAAGCPYPSMFIYRYVGTAWQQVPYARSPVRVVENNTTMDPKSDRRSIEAHQFMLPAGEVRVLSHPVDQHYYGIDLDRFPTQVFQCPTQKRLDFK